MNRMAHTSHLSAVILPAGICLLSGVLHAQTPNYFPLESGDTWLFRSVTINQQTHSLESDFQSVRVRSKEKIGEQDYFNVSYFGRDVVLRSNQSTGEVVQYDRVSGVELPWLSLSLPVGATFPTTLTRCPTQAKVTSRDGQVAIPDGDPTDVVQIDFNPACPDTGASRQFYAP